MTGDLLARCATVAFAGTSLLLTGLAWVVQVVVYPAFALVGPGPGWRGYHEAHGRRMALAVTVPWALEGLAAAVLLVDRPAGSPLALVLAGDACAAVTVAVTLAAALPAHARLARGWDPAVLQGLLRPTPSGWPPGPERPAAGWRSSYGRRR